MKLAIACAYLVPEHSRWLLDLQLRQIERAAKGHDLTIYGVNIRLDEGLAAELDALPFFHLLPQERPANFPNREHGNALDQAIDAARSDNPDLLVTLDVDSFPVTDNAFDTMLAKAKSSGGVAAICRTENGQHWLPHPAGTALTGAFLKRFDFNFFPEQNVLESAPFRRFFDATAQDIDTGIGLAELVWREKIDWQKLTRSNTLNLHPMLAGIYDDLIFHYGTGSRRPFTMHEHRLHPILAWSFPFERWPILWRVYHHFKEKAIDKNVVLTDQIKAAMIENFDAFVHTLSIKSP